jgi:ribosomal-protein-alanine N-acetyltransferase
MSQAIPTLKTPRLILQPLELNDAKQIQEIFPRWEIVRFLASHIPWPYPADGALTYIRDKALSAMDQGAEWHWSLRPESEPRRLIGVISLMDQPDNNRGFWLDPAWQGRGLMTEACGAVTDYWFDVLKRPVLRAPKAAVNVRSRRLSERGGMRLIKTVEYDYVSGRLPCEVWEITREEWQDSRLRFVANH